MKSSFMRLGCLGWQARLLLGTSSPRYTRSPIWHPEASWGIIHSLRGILQQRQVIGGWLIWGLAQRWSKCVGPWELRYVFVVLRSICPILAGAQIWPMRGCTKSESARKKHGRSPISNKSPSSTIWMVAEIGHPHNPSYLYLGLF